MWPYYQRTGRYSFILELPKQSSRVVALARSCFPFGEEEAFLGATVWFRDWGIWNELDEEVGLRIAVQMRAALGETRSLLDVPGHVFASSEFVDARAFWTLPMIFGWDAILFPEREDYFVFTSHDEFVCLISQSEERHAALPKVFKDGEPKVNDWYFRLRLSSHKVDLAGRRN